jgi:hypothetical protein
MELRASALVVLLLLGPGPLAAEELAFRGLQPGVEYAQVELASIAGAGEGVLHLVRLDPAVAPLRLLFAGELGVEPRTAEGWGRAEGLSVVTNLGMFEADHRTHTGYARRGGYVNSPDWRPRYQSALVLGPRGPGLGAGRLLDLDRPAERALAGRHDVVVQNLRLIRAPGLSVWAPSPRRWSEAALAEDAAGRLLLVFLRAPRDMPAFNRLLLSLPLGVRRAQHLEGGPEASLSVHAGGVDVDLCGSHETGFREDDSNHEQWALPNVLGVARAP